MTTLKPATTIELRQSGQAPPVEQLWYGRPLTPKEMDAAFRYLSVKWATL